MTAQSDATDAALAAERAASATTVANLNATLSSVQDQLTASQSQTATLTSQLAAANAEIATLEAELGGQTPPPPPPPPPPPSTTFRVGAYTGGNAFPPSVKLAKQTVASFYVAHGGSLPAAVTAAAKAGCAIQIEISSAHSGGYDKWVDFAPTTDANGATVAAKFDADLIRWRTSLNNLIATYGVEVWASFENEPDEKISNGEAATGQTAAQYVAAANHFADVMTASGSKVQPSVWLAGNKSTATSFLPSVSKFQHISWDPYKTGTHAATDTATDVFKPFYTKLVTAGWGKVRMHISETGIVTNKGFNATVQAAFYTSMRDVPKNLPGIESVVVFWDNSGGKTYTTTDATVIAALAATAS